MNPEAQRNLKRIYLASLGAYASMLGAVILYGALALWVLQRLQTSGPHFSSFWLPGIAAVIAALQFWLSFRARYFAREKYPDAVTHPAALEVYTSSLLRSSIVGYAVCETIALDGLILTFLTGKITWFWIFAALCAACFFLHLPKQSEWEQWLEHKLSGGVS